MHVVKHFFSFLECRIFESSGETTHSNDQEVKRLQGTHKRATFVSPVKT